MFDFIIIVFIKIPNSKIDFVFVFFYHYKKIWKKRKSKLECGSLY